jgi:threonine synthase
MRYVSTRGRARPLGFQDVVIAGLADDGGLFLPERLPDVSERLDDWRGLSYVDLAAQLLPLFVDDIEPRTLRELLGRAYASFDAPDVTPLRRFDDLCVLELFHGPTLAFKDVALQLLGQLFEHILTDRGASLNILGSTSGDTGSAAIAGVRGKSAMSVFVMYPDGRTSPLQELQMTTVLDPNVHCLAIRGTFDDCQALMKEAFNDLEFKTRYRLGAVNSVNWARLMAQIVYYVYAALELDDGGRRRVSFSVPTGNFGDVFAGYLALQMGLPIDRLICATNENDILSVFFNSGLYRRGKVRHTITPSMDIQVASNFERFLYLRMGRDSARLCAFMESFARDGEARLDDGAPIDANIVATAIDTGETRATIADVYDRYGYLVDPHTAVGIAAGRQFAVDGPMVCLATAHPAKFPESVDAAVGAEVARHPALDALKDAPTRRTLLDPDLGAVKAFIAAHAI